jgi:hypothetical protein
MSKTIQEQKNEIIRKAYGGKREPYFHKFNKDTGICEYCGDFLDCVNEDFGRVCRIITPEETKNWNQKE